MSQRRIIIVPGEGVYGERWYYLRGDAPAHIGTRDALMEWAGTRGDPNPHILHANNEYYILEYRPDLAR